MKLLLAFSLLATAPGATCMAQMQERQDNPVRMEMCPFGCASLNLPSDKCREWRNGDSCFVQDLRSSDGLSENARGRYVPGVEEEGGYSREGEDHQRGAPGSQETNSAEGGFRR